MSKGYRFRPDPSKVLDDLRNPAFSSFLDMARWMAALLVFVGHLRLPLFLGYGSLDEAQLNLAVQGWYFVTGWFGEAVIVFFVLSGYLVGGIGLAKIATMRFLPRDYAIDRFTRLYAAFLPALLLTLILDLIGSNYFGDSGLYDGTQAMIAQKLAHLAPFYENLTWLQFLGTLFMLQTFHVTPFGTNAPLWTISCEFWFYVLFGLALITWPSEPGAPRRRILAGGLLIAALLLLGPVFPIYLGIWLIGMAIALLPHSRPGLRWPALILFMTLLFAIRAFGHQLEELPYYLQLRNYAVALSFGLVLHTMRELRAPWLARIAGLNRRIADFSFSLYLIHYPLMLFILSALYTTGWFPGIHIGYGPTDATGLALYFCIIATVVACAALFAQVTEKQTGTLREILHRVLA